MFAKLEDFEYATYLPVQPLDLDVTDHQMIRVTQSSAVKG